jgi:hypothetical protein
MDCDFNNPELTCAACGFTTTIVGLRRNCPTSEFKPAPVKDEAEAVLESLGLGDMVAAGLESVGITKERWNAWKGEVGPCPTCGQRQEWLNKMGRKVTAWLKR